MKMASIAMDELSDHGTIQQTSSESGKEDIEPIDPIEPNQDIAQDDSSDLQYVFSERVSGSGSDEISQISGEIEENKNMETYQPRIESSNGSP